MKLVYQYFMKLNLLETAYSLYWIIENYRFSMVIHFRSSDRDQIYIFKHGIIYIFPSPPCNHLSAYFNQTILHSWMNFEVGINAHNQALFLILSLLHHSIPICQMVIFVSFCFSFDSILKRNSKKFQQCIDKIIQSSTPWVILAFSNTIR